MQLFTCAVPHHGGIVIKIQMEQSCTRADHLFPLLCTQVSDLAQGPSQLVPDGRKEDTVVGILEQVAHSGLQAFACRRSSIDGDAALDQWIEAAQYTAEGTLASTIRPDKCHYFSRSDMEIGHTQRKRLVRGDRTPWMHNGKVRAVQGVVRKLVELLLHGGELQIAFPVVFYDNLHLALATEGPLPKVAIGIEISTEFIKVSRGEHHDSPFLLQDSGQQQLPPLFVEIVERFIHDPYGSIDGFGYGKKQPFSFPT